MIPLRRAGCASCPAVDVLRRVLLQNYTRAITADGREVIKRREKEPEGDGLPPGHARIASPYDTDARWGVKREEFWLGYKLHITETCDDAPPCSCRATAAARPAAEGAVAGGRGGSGRGHDRACAHLVFPNLITHVATTDATVTDNQMTGAIDDDLAGKNLAPGRHYLDSGYLSAALVVAGHARHGIALIGPLLADTSAQARAGHGYARADFTVDYDTKTVTCPQGKTSSVLDTVHPARQGRYRGHLLRHRLRPLPGPQPVHHRANDAQLTAAAPRPGRSPGRRPSRGKDDPCSRPTTPAAPASRAPCTRPPATAPAAPATAACRKPASTTCTWPARSTSCAWRPTGPARRSTGSEPATWHASNSASPHEPELTTSRGCLGTPCGVKICGADWLWRAGVRCRAVV